MRRKEFNTTYVIGVDVGGSSIKAGLISSNGEIRLELPKEKTADFSSADAIAGAIRRMIAKLLKTRTAGAIKAIGVGVPGAVSSDGKRVTAMPNLSVFNEYPLGSRLRKWFPLPSFIDNTTNNAARAEFLFGNARGLGDFVLVTMGTGIGGALFFDGKLYVGAGSYAGEVGHTIVVPDGKMCGCGKAGCWEAHSSAKAMVGNAKSRLSGNSSSKLRRYAAGDLSAYDILTQAKAGDELAARIFDESCRCSGIAIANLINTLNPRAFIIGGGLSNAGNFLLKNVKRCVKPHCLPRSLELCEFRLAKLSGEAGLVGAGALAFMTMAE